MKTTLITSLLVLSFSAFGQERVELSSELTDINDSTATVVRTNKTPEKVEITFRVPMANSVCERYDTRAVLRTSGMYCGYDIIERRISAGRVCTRRHPQKPDECQRWEETYRFERIQRPRTCMVPETFCVQYGTATSFERDSMKLQFKDLPSLADSESETFLITAQQKRLDNGDVVYEVKPLETLREYKVTQKKFLLWKRDAYVIEEK